MLVSTWVTLSYRLASYNVTSVFLRLFFIKLNNLTIQGITYKARCVGR